MVPKPGDNKVVFKLTDRFNNTTSSEVFITREKNLANNLLVRPEYSRIIASKQVIAFTAMLQSRANDKLKTIINEARIEDHQFGNVDEIISYLKTEAAKKSIGPDEIDKLALKVAVSIIYSLKLLSITWQKTVMET